MTWYTVEEAAALKGCSTKTIRRMIESGKIQSKKEFTGNGKGGFSIFVSLDPNGQQMDKNIAHPDVQKPEIMDTEQVDKAKKLPIIEVSNDIEPNGPSNELMDISESTIEIAISDPNGQQMDINWIPIDDLCVIAELSRRTVFLKIQNQEFKSIVVKDAVSKTKTLISVDTLPKSIQLKWREQAVTTINDPIKKDFELLPIDVKEKAWAKYSIVKEYINQKAKTTKNKMAFSQYFVDKVNHYEILEKDIKLLGGISLKSLMRWEKTLRDNGNPSIPLCLCDKKKGQVGRKKLTDRLFVDKVKKMAWDFRNLKATEVYRLVEMELVSVGQTMPISLRTMTGLVEKARKDQVAMAINKGKKAYKDNIRAHVHRINNALPGDIYESDGHTMNNLVLSPFYAHYKQQLRFLVKPVVIVWFDIATGCIVGHCMCLAENSNAVRTALNEAIKNYGLPRILRMDNGSAYKNVDYCPHIFAGRKNNNASKTKAIAMISQGNKGLYKNLGCEYQFTIAGNSESKMIEPFWNYCISFFEKQFPVWIGNKIENRHEELRLTNKILIKKYGDQIPTWEQYESLLDQYVIWWNNNKRSLLHNALKEPMSPNEVFIAEAETKKLSDEELERIAVYPYPSQAQITRGEIQINGIYYSHPMFMPLQGRTINCYYNEKDITQIKIASTDGEVFTESAKMVLPGLQVGDDMTALIDSRHREKIGKAAYLALQGIEGIENMHKALNDSTNNLIADQSRIQEETKKSRINLITSRQPQPRKYQPQEIKTPEISDDIFNTLKDTKIEEENNETDFDAIFNEVVNRTVDNDQDEMNTEIDQALKKLGLE